MIQYKYSMVNFWLTNIEKEEAWINQWVAKGYRLKKVTIGFGRYGFEKTETKEEQEKGLYQIRMDFRTFEREADYQDYLAMFEDSGWYHIHSKALRYRRIVSMYLLLALAFLPQFIMHLQNGDFIPFAGYESWKSLYYTPGLWELGGIRFMGAFLFETPFALGRAIGELSGVLILLLLLFFCYHMLRLWYRSKNKY